MRLITAVNYAQLDLNLLRVFDAVMTELNVTRAADRLQMTQPAVSNALNRLRRLLKDELFIKVPTGVSPTPKATEIWLPLREALAQIRQTLEPEPFTPAETAATFTIAMNDLIAHLILPELIPLLTTTAPQVNLRTLPSTNIDAPMLLEQAKIDLAIGVFPDPGSRMRSQVLLLSPFVCVMRHDHPLAKKKLTLDCYIDAKHLLVTLTGESTGWMDTLLQERGLSRRIVATVNQFAIAPQLITSSDLIAALPTRLVQKAELANQLHVTSLPNELQVPPFAIKMMWHERNHRSAAQAWLRHQLTGICGAF